MSIRHTATSPRVLTADKRMWDLWKELGSLSMVADHLAREGLQQGMSSYSTTNIQRRAKKYIVEFAIKDRVAAKTEYEEAAEISISDLDFEIILAKFSISAFRSQPTRFFKAIESLGLWHLRALWESPDGVSKVHAPAGYVSRKNGVRDGKLVISPE